MHATEPAPKAPKQHFEQTGYRYKAFRTVLLTPDQFEYSQQHIVEDGPGGALLYRLHTKTNRCCAENIPLTALAAVLKTYAQ